MQHDKHMNLFEHENNVSRALAILFDSEPLLLDRFIRLVNGKLTGVPATGVPAIGVPPVNPPTRRGGMSVGFRQEASDLAEDTGFRVICLTLTPDKQTPVTAAASSSLSLSPAAQSESDPVTDISLVSEDDLLLIEVKKQNGESAGAQAFEQAQKIRGLISREKNPPDIIGPVNITWGEMMDVLEDVYDLQCKNERSPLGHYLRYLNAHCQAWSSVRPFQAYAQNNRTPVLTRLQNLADNCLNGAPAVCADESAVVPADFGFAREFRLSAEWDGPVFKGIKAVLWPGNNGAQSRFLFGCPDVRDDMSWTRGGRLVTGAESAAAVYTVAPYLKFSHIMGRYVMSEYCSPETVGADREEIREKFAAPLNGKWEKSRWGELKKFLMEDHPNLLQDPEGFKKSFEFYFENSGRKFALVTFGYEAVIRFPLESLIKHEAVVNENFTPAGDAAARWVVQSVEALRDKILK